MNSAHDPVSNERKPLVEGTAAEARAAKAANFVFIFDRKLVLIGNLVSSTVFFLAHMTIFFAAHSNNFSGAIRHAGMVDETRWTAHISCVDDLNIVQHSMPVYSWKRGAINKPSMWSDCTICWSRNYEKRQLLNSTETMLAVLHRDALSLFALHHGKFSVLFSPMDSLTLQRWCASEAGREKYSLLRSDMWIIKPDLFIALVRGFSLLFFS